MARRSLLLPLFGSLLLSCESIPTAPLESVLSGGDPGTLDWRIPEAAETLPLLEEWDASRVRRLEPSRRAMIQRDLWMAFRQRLHDPARAPVRQRLARMIGDLALTADEIRALPDTYAESAKDPARLLPADLFDPEGAWVPLASNWGTLASQHTFFFGAGSAFLIFVHHPGGREATRSYVASLRGLPEVPVGMEFVLLRRALLISDQGVPVPSPITESVQIRRYVGRNGNDQVFQKFELRRSDLRLHPFGPDERKPSYALSFEHSCARLSLGRPVLGTCIECHGIPGSGGVQIFALMATSDLKIFRAARVADELDQAAGRARQEDEWKILRDLWAR